MSLPAWVIEASKESGASRLDYTPRLVQALSIAWEALGNHSHTIEPVGSCPWCEAIREIEELGK